MSGNVRERLQQETNNGPDRAVTTDHSTSKWGSIQVTQRIENQKQVSYLLACSCGSRGQRVSQQELASGVVPVCRLCHGTGVTPGDAPRRAGIAEEFIPRPTASPRERAQQAARAKEIAEMEGAQ
jgi:cytochrome c553